MPKFGQLSEARLATVHPDLVTVCRTVIVYMDFTIVRGWRSQHAQHAAFVSGASKLDWPHSRHNHTEPDEQGIVRPCSLAVDITPYHAQGKPTIDWLQTEDFVLLAGRMLQAADLLGTPIRWGGDWNRNNETKDERFRDYGHFELARKGT